MWTSDFLTTFRFLYKSRCVALAKTKVCTNRGTSIVWNLYKSIMETVSSFSHSLSVGLFVNDLLSSQNPVVYRKYETFFERWLTTMIKTTFDFCVDRFKQRKRNSREKTFSNEDRWIRYSENYRILRVEVLQNNKNKNSAHRRPGTSTAVAIEEISPWQRSRTTFVVTIGILIAMQHGRTIAPETETYIYVGQPPYIYIKRMTNVYSLKMSKKS